MLEGNPSSAGAGEREVVASTSWSGCYEFKPAGRGNAGFPDETTKHPMFTLGGKGRPSTVPVMYICGMYVRVTQVTELAVWTVLFIVRSKGCPSLNSLCQERERRWA